MSEKYRPVTNTDKVIPLQDRQYLIEIFNGKNETPRARGDLKKVLTPLRIDYSGIRKPDVE
jgi:hypothetical protein